MRSGPQDRGYSSSARDGVTPANAGQDVPKRLENAAHRRFHRFKIYLIDVTAQHLPFGSRMFAVCFNMDAEVFIMFWISEAVILFQSVNLGFTNRRNLAFVAVERGQSFCRRSLTAN